MSKIIKVIHESTGDGRWVNHKVFRLRDDGDVDIESWLEDEDFISARRENEKYITVSVGLCPKKIQDEFAIDSAGKT